MLAPPVGCRLGLSSALVNHAAVASELLVEVLLEKSSVVEVVKT